MKKKTKRPNQTSFTLSDDLKAKLDAFCKKRGLKKAYVIEQSVQKFLTMQE